jgi:Fe2+ or Zn2+ uptake regulation protein
MNRKLTANETRVLEILKNSPNKELTPTVIGQTLGKSYNDASPFASPILKRLSEKGLIKKVDFKKGKYIYEEKTNQ